ncbi:hypothetical protein [Nocardia aurantiaca]|nr:hypothetical protein [Nocardia aurantiaca]
MSHSGVITSELTEVPWELWDFAPHILGGHRLAHGPGIGPAA